MSHCKKYGGVKNVKQTIASIESFCGMLRANKVKDTKEAFLKLPLVVQCLLLHHAWDILSKKSKHSEDSYMTAFRLFKLFRGKDMKSREIYASKYGKLGTIEIYYKSALEWSKKSPVKTSRKKYEKELQKYEAPSGELDPLYIYYTSLYAQNPDSRLAITWLTEHGVFEEDERENLVTKYKKLSAKNKLIK